MVLVSFFFFLIVFSLAWNDSPVRGLLFSIARLVSKEWSYVSLDLVVSSEEIWEWLSSLSVSSLDDRLAAIDLGHQTHIVT